ncbi:MAG TPA: peptidoglycan-binding domain-containing protein, partial [Acetobacteraceae bacterium]|nr:peptidoglycan-binding domain-containing protein [Acetobacteraceae bacterium]
GGASHQAEAAGAPAAAASTTPTAPVAAPSPASAALSLRQILTSWIMGYLTASDRLVKDTFDETPVMAPEALTNMVIGVCRRNPDARVEAVANSVLTQLATARLLHDSPVVEARQGAQTVLIRQATLVAMQKALERDKLLKDPADGKFGGGTAAALLAFQKSQHLPETSLPDSDTVVRLLVEMPAAAPVATKRPRRAR